jgi:hypothetical protein
MKKLVVFLLLGVCLLSSGIAISHELKGDVKSALPFEAVALACMVVPAIASKRITHSLGYSEELYPESAPLGYGAARKYLLDYLNGRIPGYEPQPETAQALSTGKLQILPYSQKLLFKIPISSGGRMELMNNVTAASQGRIPNEWDKGALPGGSVIAFNFARLGYATDGTVTVPEGDIDYSNTVDSWPAALRNADLIWTQMATLKFRLGAHAFGTKAASTRSAVKSDGYNFDVPVIIEPKKQNLIELYCPAGITFPATPAGLFLELAIDGAAIIQSK